MKSITKGTIAAAITMLVAAFPAFAQDSSIYVQCPTATTLHPDSDGNASTRSDGIKCDHLIAGDGMVSMADEAYVNDDGSNGGKHTYIFGFARVPLPGEGGAPTAASGDYPGWVMEEGMLKAESPASTIIVDEDDELFLSLTNVGMVMRPDLFDPHTVHWHGFPNASAVFDGVPDASISINMGATLTYYYNAKDAGTYMYHCHVEAAEHMQMGMLGNLYVRPRQNRLADGTALDHKGSTFVHATGNTYVYNDGDGTTRYDVEFPIQMGSFDPDFHDASFNVQPLPFAGMRDRYFLLNGRGYPDTINTGAIQTPDPLDGRMRDSQPVSSLIQATSGQRVLLRISNLSVTQFYTLGTSGPAMEVVGLDARLLRDDGGNNMYYKTNSLTLGGGQSADVIIDTSGLASGSTFFLYAKDLDRLSNDAENFGGMMTEIRIN